MALAASYEQTAGESRRMPREEIAEWVGYYFGLQRAGNLRLTIPRGDGESRALNDLRKSIDAEMAKIVKMLPPGTIDGWPHDRSWMAAHRVDGQI